jgi:hypothetical protein
MAITGYITSSGILQVFTTGPYSGSEVTSSYSDGSTLFGGILNTFQPFISGDLDTITPCETDNIIPGVNFFERFYYDPTICTPDDTCLSPILLSVNRNTPCNDNNSTHSISYSSGSSTADYTIIEYSTFNNFTPTGSTILDNSILTSSLNIPINILINGLSPQASTPVYFRAYNSCSNDSISGYSSIKIANNCVSPPNPYENFTFNIVNDTSYTVQTTNGTGSGTIGPWFNVPTNNPTGNSYNFNTSTGNFFFKVSSPANCPNQGIYVELTTTTPLIESNVNTNVSTTLVNNDCSGNGLGIQTSNYSGTEYFLHYPTTDINTQISTNIFINRTDWVNIGNIKMTIKYQAPSNPGDLIIGLD